jgi:hypothetical protein
MLSELHVFGARSVILGIDGGRRKTSQTSQEFIFACRLLTEFLRDYLFHMLRQNVIVSHLEVSIFGWQAQEGGRHQRWVPLMLCGCYADNGAISRIDTFIQRRSAIPSLRRKLTFPGRRTGLL